MNNIRIRTALPEDAEALLGIYSYYILYTAITYEYDIPTLEEFRNRIIHIQERYPYLVLEKDGQIIGYAYAGAFNPRAAYDWSCEMTIYLDHRVEKQGYGRLLYEELERRLKEMGILNLYACIGYPQTEDEYLTRNSAQFHEHLGYRLAGTFTRCGYKFGRWYDMIWMEKIIGEHEMSQKTPRFGRWDANLLSAEIQV